jgi:hypothetical protein
MIDNSFKVKILKTFVEIILRGFSDGRFFMLFQQESTVIKILDILEICLDMNELY